MLLPVGSNEHGRYSRWEQWSSQGSFFWFHTENQRYLSFYGILSHFRRSVHSRHRTQVISPVHFLKYFSSPMVSQTTIPVMCLHWYTDRIHYLIQLWYCPETCSQVFFFKIYSASSGRR